MSLTVVKGFISFFKSWPKSKLEENCIFGERERPESQNPYLFIYFG